MTELISEFEVWINWMRSTEVLILMNKIPDMTSDYVIFHIIPKLC